MTLEELTILTLASTKSSALLANDHGGCVNGCAVRIQGRCWTPEYECEWRLCIWVQCSAADVITTHSRFFQAPIPTTSAAVTLAATLPISYSFVFPIWHCHLSQTCLQLWATTRQCIALQICKIVLMARHSNRLWPLFNQASRPYPEHQNNDKAPFIQTFWRICLDTGKLLVPSATSHLWFSTLDYI